MTEYIGGRAFTREEAWARLLRHVGHWTLFGYGTWIVESRPERRYVGEVGFGDWRRDVTPSVDGIPEIGWVLAPSAHGRGLATEAARAALAWRDAALPAGATVCLIDPRHAASLRVAAKLGFQPTRTSPHRGNPILVLHRAG